MPAVGGNKFDIMSKLISKKGIVIFVIPIFALFLQVFLRLILDKDLNTIGITLGALGLGQILPFFYFDHFVANKILGIAPKFNILDNEFQVVYKMRPSSGITEKEIENLKNWFVIAVFLNLALFIIIIYLGLTGKIILHTLFGVLSCVVSWYLLIFK